MNKILVVVVVVVEKSTHKISRCLMIDGDDDGDGDDDDDDDDDDDIQVLPVGLFSYLFLTRSNRKHVQR